MTLYLLSLYVWIHINNMSVCLAFLLLFHISSKMVYHLYCLFDNCLLLSFPLFVHCCQPLATILTTILLHVILLCVTVIIPSWNFVCMFIVSVHYVVFCFFFQIVVGCFLQCDVLMFLFYMSHRYCLAVISVVFTCLLFLVISCLVFVMCFV